MIDVTRLTALLEHRYRASVVGVVPIFETAEKAIYRVERHDGPAWVVRLFPRSRPIERVEGDPAILRYVESHGVPAERLGATIGDVGAIDFDGRGLLVTRFVEGVRLDRRLSLAALVLQPQIPSGDEATLGVREFC